MLKNFMILCTTDIKICLFFILFKNGERYRFLVTHSVSCHFVCVCVLQCRFVPHIVPLKKQCNKSTTYRTIGV